MANDRIFYGWFVLVVCFFIQLVGSGTRVGLGVFVLPMSAEFDWDRTTISLAMAIGILVGGAVQPFMGYTFDKFGSRQIICWCLLVLGASTILLSLTPNILYFIVVYGFVMAIAVGGSSGPVLQSLVSKWFLKKRGLALSISMGGMACATLFMMPFATYMILATDWRTTWVVLGSFVIFLALPLAFFIIKETPASVGQLFDGRKAQAGSDNSDSSANTRSDMTPPLYTERWTQSFNSAPMWQLSGGFFVCGVTTLVIGSHYVPFAIDRGFSPEEASWAFGVMGLLNFFGVLVVGAISDKLGRKNLLGLMYAIRALAFGCIVLVPGTMGLWLFAIFAGISWLSTPPLTSALTADIYGLKNIGTLNGLVTFSHQIGGALAVLGAGILYDMVGGYEIPFGIAGITLVGATLVSLMVNEKKYSIRYQADVTGPPMASQTTGSYD